jgi:enoyl-CoA hydratase/3-hydroxyacyl-CoA dehydrogenase
MSIARNNPLLSTPNRSLPKSVGIVGAGTIGPDIGYYLKSAMPEIELVLVDVAQAPLDRAVERIHGYVKKGVEKGKLNPKLAAQVTEKIVPTLDYGKLAACEWVVEAATENLELKRKIFQEIERVVRPDAFVTSNTSSLPASRIFAGLKNKGRATVTHFFAPAFQNPAVEVVQWSEVSPATLEYLRWVLCVTGKVPLVTDDAVCFMLDRVFDNWCNEAAYLLESATASEIDTVAMELVNAGPFFVLNLANGNPIIVETNTLQASEEGAHYQPAPIFRSVDKWRTVAPGKGVKVEPARAQTIRDRLLGVLLSQAVDIVDRKIGTASDLDLGCLLALGFKQGPLDLMQKLGDAEVRRIFDRLVKERGAMPTPKNDLASYRGFHKHLLVDDLEGVKVLTMRRPQAMNALDDDVTDELLSVIREFEGDEKVSGFVITGYGNRSFCAGADIGRFPELLGKSDEAAQFARDCSRLLVHLDAMKKPVVAALNGMALGGGLELAMRCHARVSVREAFLQLPEVTLGIAPGIGALVVPYRRWPKAATIFHDMLRLGRKLGAAEACELGVVDGLADDYGSLVRLAVDRVKALRGKLTPIAAGAVQIPPLGEIDPTKQKLPLSREVVGIISRAIVDAAAAPTVTDALEIGYRAFGATACTAAAKEGVSAFGQRRAPDFGKTG